MSLPPPDLEQLARAEISKRYGGVITLSELMSFFQIPEDRRFYYLELCNQVENEYLTNQSRN